MKTTIFLAGWESEGLRCPDHTISFERGAEQVHQISLVQMPNGTGKTTTLSLLRSALSGEADEDRWTANKVRALAKRGNESGAGSFRVRLIINGRLTTICMNFDFGQGVVTYSTTLSSGLKNGFHPPQGAEKFLVPEFVNFFVFDGELAEHLLSRNHTDAQTVIENLFHLSLFADLRAAVSRYYDEKTAHADATEERGLARRRNRVDGLRSRLVNMKNERKIAVARYEDTQNALSKHKTKFDVEIKKEREHGQKLLSAQRNLAAADNTLQKLVQTTLAKMRDPHALSATLAVDMLHLKSSLDKVKLPESTAREFFEELSEELECICGRELTDERRKAIRERAKQYLGSEDVAFLNALKGDVSQRVGSDPHAHEADTNDHIARLGEAMDAKDEAQTAYEALEAEAVANDPAAKKEKEQIERLEDDLRRLDEARKKYESLDTTQADERTYGIKVLEKRLEDAEQKLAEITQTVNLRKKQVVLERILQESAKSARAGISEEISAETNTRIAEVMPNNTIRVQRIERCLVLDGQEGGSAGETLSVAYAFLATLFNRVDHQLPFIVDSPANPIDLHIRARVAQLIPRLTGQFVAFTISSERQGFVNQLEAAAKEPVQFITLFRRPAGNLEARSAAHRQRVLTTDGVLVHGKEFFMDFHVETEESDLAVSAT